MATNWIKIREDLHEDPAVIRMARELGIGRNEVVGNCILFWSWASRNTRDGFVTHVTLADVENVLHLPNFLKALASVGWLEVLPTGSEALPQGGIRIPHFEYHLSESAKKRALDARRQSKHRVTQTSRSERDVTQMSRSERDKFVTGALPDKIRVDKTISTKVDIEARAQNRPPKPPSTIEEVRAYIATRPGCDVDARRFWDYYEAAGWRDSRGQPVRCWKQRIISWENHGGSTNGHHQPTSRPSSVEGNLDRLNAEAIRDARDIAAELSDVAGAEAQSAMADSLFDCGPRRLPDP